MDLRSRRTLVRRAFFCLKMASRLVESDAGMTVVVMVERSGGDDGSWWRKKKLMEAERVK